MPQGLAGIDVVVGAARRRVDPVCCSRVFETQVRSPILKRIAKEQPSCSSADAGEGITACGEAVDVQFSIHGGASPDAPVEVEGHVVVISDAHLLLPDP